MSWIELKNAKFSSKTKQLVLPMTHAQTFGNEELTLQIVKKNGCATESDLYIALCISPLQADCNLLTC